MTVPQGFCTPNDYISEIMNRGNRNKKKYTAFLRGLKKKKKLPLEYLFKEAHQTAFKQINCLDCAMCCTGLGPRITNRDISGLSRRERLKPAIFIKQFLRIDEDGDYVFKTMPCPFLGQDNYCSIYEDKPEACSNYPHMNHGRQSGRIDSHIENLLYCPAVVLGVEFLMEELS